MSSTRVLRRDTKPRRRKVIVSQRPARRRWLTSFIPHRLELLKSPAWRQAPRPLRRMLERLEIEHLRHGGFNNGELYVSVTQFVEAGISRRMVKATSDLGEQLGLMAVTRQESKGDIRAPNAYALTYVPLKGKNTPTDEWKSITEERAKSLVRAFTNAGRRGAQAKCREGK